MNSSMWFIKQIFLRSFSQYEKLSIKETSFFPSQPTWNIRKVIKYTLFQKRENRIHIAVTDLSIDILKYIWSRLANLLIKAQPYTLGITMHGVKHPKKIVPLLSLKGWDRKLFSKKTLVAKQPDRSCSRRIHYCPPHTRKEEASGIIYLYLFPLPSDLILVSSICQPKHSKW